VQEKEDSASRERGREREGGARASIVDSRSMRRSIERGRIDQSREREPLPRSLRLDSRREARGCCRNDDIERIVARDVITRKLNGNYTYTLCLINVTMPRIMRV